MENADWEQRWRDGRIGFHEGRPNTFLEAHVGRLGTGKRVLVPLCGKAEDLAFLARQGHQVVGVELVADAVRAFFDEHQMTPKVSRRDGFEIFEADNIRLLAGDFFATTLPLLGEPTALYDRAALIALPSDLQKRYVDHVRKLMPRASTGIVITFEYPEEAMTAPPFSVGEERLRKHYAGLEVTLLDSRPGFNSRLGTAVATEQVFQVQF